MTPDFIADLLRLGHETRGVEFKASGSLKDGRFAAKVARAILGMSNKRDGGYVTIGVDDDHTGLQASGLTQSDQTTWNHDDLADMVAKYADPSVELRTSLVELDGQRLFVIRVEEFDDVPVFCKKPYPEILENRLYVRSRKKPETSEVATAEDLREVIELAVDKRLQKWLRQSIDAGIIRVVQPGLLQDDEDLFNRQLGVS
jgi:predicted HTH transcriptional regulator